ncbi:hypothetical protein AAMO2058_000879600 [Amorphochlora amoebiformis]
MPTGRGSQGRKRKGKPFARGAKKGPRKVRRAEEVLFDENDRKEFLTGFRKRKQQRRERGLLEQKESEKRDRRLKRKEKREALKDCEDQSIVTKREEEQLKELKEIAKKHGLGEESESEEASKIPQKDKDGGGAGDSDQGEGPEEGEGTTSTMVFHTNEKHESDDEEQVTVQVTSHIIGLFPDMDQPQPDPRGRHRQRKRPGETKGPKDCGKGFGAKRKGFRRKGKPGSRRKSSKRGWKK